MIRYAYGGLIGIVKGYGEELGYSSNATSFQIGSGCVVLQGWEVEIDGAGWLLDISSVTGTRYYTVYLEVNAEIETAEIKSIYDTAAYPQVDRGDDLTEAQSGTARFPIYKILVSSGSITEVSRTITTIPYAIDEIARISAYFGGQIDTVNHTLTSHTQKISSIESRLSALGFRQGVATLSGGTATRNSLKRQGKYVIFDLVFNTTGRFQVQIPSGFRPTAQKEIPYVYGSSGGIAYVNTDGSITLSGVGTSATVKFVNLGWETRD
jgi:hypothetical protein